MLRVGLTGSIAVGKSFVLEVFRELGCNVLDADLTAREIVEPGELGLKLVVENFGDRVLTEGGELDRKRLGAIIFGDEKKRLLLNSLLHPLIQEKQDKWLNKIELSDSKGIAIIDAALLIESGGYKRFDKIIVVWCELSVQIERLVNRESISRESAIEKIRAQLSQEEKKAYADYLIDTSKGFEATRESTCAVFEKLKNG